MSGLLGGVLMFEEKWLGSHHGERATTKLTVTKGPCYGSRRFGGQTSGNRGEPSGAITALLENSTVCEKPVPINPVMWVALGLRRWSQGGCVPV